MPRGKTSIVVEVIQVRGQETVILDMEGESAEEQRLVTLDGSADLPSDYPARLLAFVRHFVRRPEVDRYAKVIKERGW